APDNVANIRLQPGITRIAAAALINELPTFQTNATGNCSAGFQKLILIRLRKRRRHAVRGEEHLDVTSLLERDLIHLAAQLVNDCINKQWMLEPGFAVVNAETSSTLGPNLLDCFFHGCLVTSPTGLSLVRRENDS